MRWIVTVDASADLAAVEALLADAGASRGAGQEAVPLESERELALEVEGPSDLPRLLRPAKEIKGVYPSSEMTTY